MVVGVLLFLLGAVADNSDYCYGGAKPNAQISVPPVPSGYSLRMVTVVTRHGARTPLRTLPSLQPTWDCEENELAVLSTHDQHIEDVHLLFRKVAVRNTQSLPGNCFLGQLTALGAAQHASIGKGFRHAFVLDYPLLNTTLVPSQLYLRATDVPRVQQSAESQLLHLFPDAKALLRVKGKPMPVLQLNVVEHPKDNLIPTPKTCSYITKLTTDSYNSSEWKNAVAAIADVVRALDSTYGVKINPASSDLEDFADSFHVMDCHNMTFPTALSLPMRLRLYEALNHLWHVRYMNTLLCLLSVGGFVNDLLPVFSRAAHFNASDAVFRLYSGHDTTLAPLLHLLGIFDGFWPPLASQLMLQVLTNSSRNAFVRAIYNGKLVPMPACPEDCPLPKFLNLLSTLQTQHKDAVTKYCH